MWSLFRISLIVLFLQLAACSTGKIVKTYDGEALMPAKVAILSTGGGIVVTSVNGKAVKTYLLNSLEIRYGLKPGKNRIVFRYESIWGRSKKVDGGSVSEAVVSALQEVVIDAKVGASYVFSYTNPANVREARSLAAAFEADLFDQNNAFVVASHVLQDVESKGGHDVEISEKVSDVEKFESKSGSATTIDKMKDLWALAGSEEKKRFLVWAFQE